MLILLHGSGDDDTKPENWMPSVAAIMEFHGDLALVLPGVESSEWKLVKSRGIEFVKRLKSRWERLGRPKPGGFQIDPQSTLFKALSAGGNLTTLRDFRGALNFEKAEALINGMEQKKEGGILHVSGSGIKIRAGVAAFCAILYEGYIPEEERTPMRIVGHSRGGSSAISAHNLINVWGIVPKTLTLDPCHGVGSVRSNKKHWHTVWGGSVLNLPVVKQVAGMPAGTTKRPPITAAPDGNATVENRRKLTDIKHGHMGKLASWEEKEKKRGRAALKGELDTYLHQVAMEATMKSKPDRHHLENLYRKLAHNTGDRRVIWNAVVNAVSLTEE